MHPEMLAILYKYGLGYSYVALKPHFQMISRSLGMPSFQSEFDLQTLDFVQCLSTHDVGHYLRCLLVHVMSTSSDHGHSDVASFLPEFGNGVETEHALRGWISSEDRDLARTRFVGRRKAGDVD